MAFHTAKCWALLRGAPSAIHPHIPPKPLADAEGGCPSSQFQFCISCSRIIYMQLQCVVQALAVSLVVLRFLLPNKRSAFAGSGLKMQYFVLLVLWLLELHLKRKMCTWAREIYTFSVCKKLHIVLHTHAAFIYHIYCVFSLLISSAHTGAHLKTMLQIRLLTVVFLFNFFLVKKAG